MGIVPTSADSADERRGQGVQTNVVDHGVEGGRGRVRFELVRGSEDREVARRSQREQWRSVHQYRRRQYRFPPPRLVYGRMPGDPTRRKSYVYDIRRHLAQWGNQYQNDRHRAGLPVLSVEELAAALLDRIERHARIHHPEEPGAPRARRGTVKRETAERAATDISIFIIEGWDADYLRRASERGAAGGRKSKRPPKWTLDAYATVRHLPTRRAQWEALGCSETTVYNLARAWDAASTSTRQSAINARWTPTPKTKKRAARATPRRPAAPSRTQVEILAGHPWLDDGESFWSADRRTA